MVYFFCIFRGFNALTSVSVEHEQSRTNSMKLVLQSSESVFLQCHIS